VKTASALGRCRSCTPPIGSRQIEHIGSAHDDVELELLKAVARQRLAAGQGVLDLGPGFGSGGGGPLPITSSRMGHLLDALARGYEVLGFERPTSKDEVFRSPSPSRPWPGTPRSSGTGSSSSPVAPAA
jgi:hypothetical protein